VSPGVRSLYVVTQPESIRGIYDTWDACRAAVSGVPGARYQAVSSRAKAEALLRGEAVALPPGLYAFVDGNHAGGVGVVLVTVEAAGEQAARETATSVFEVFAGAGLARLGSMDAIREALGQLRNVLAELAGLYHALREIPAGSAVTVVHDYAGVAAWMESRWRARDRIVADVVGACRAVIGDRRLRVAFRQQRGHESTWAGRDDYAHYNARADALAADGARRVREVSE
jgi:ribonuclease HI